MLHLEHMKGFGSDNQSVEWLLGKAEKAKGKFDMDQKNREAEIARKHKLEEDEAKEAAQNRKVVAESSAKMCQTLEGSIHIFEGIAQSIGRSSDTSTIIITLRLEPNNCYYTEARASASTIIITLRLEPQPRPLLLH